MPVPGQRNVRACFTAFRIGKMMSRGMKSSPLGKPSSTPNFTADDFPTLASSIITSKQSKRRTRIDLQTTSKQKLEEVQNNGPLNHEASIPMSHSSSSKHPKQHHEHGEAKSNSASDQYDTELPPGFWEKRSYFSRSPKKSRTHHHKASRPSHSSSSKHPEQRDIDREHGEPKSISTCDHYDTELPSRFRNNLSSSRSPKQKSHTHHEYGEVKRRLTYSPATNEGEPFDICLPETIKTNSYRSSVNEKNRIRWVPKIELPDEIDKQTDAIERSLNLEEESAEECGRVLRPGMVLFKHYISLSEQVDIVTKCRELGYGPGGFYRPGYNDGAKLRLYMMCLGLDWDPQTKNYGDKRRHDDAEPLVIPQEFTSLVCRVIDDSHTLIKRELRIINVEDELPAMSPDVCIVNYYNTNGRLGLHQDRDESPESLEKGLPVVSISLGDSAEFLYGDQRDIGKAESVVLESGDVLVFGGKSRRVFHGVTSIFPDTAPLKLLENTNLRPGRLNLTFRKY